MPRLYVDAKLERAEDLALPAAAARHAQVLRLQPGDALVLFDGSGGEWAAQVSRMGRSDVHVNVLAHCPAERELPVAVTLAVGMPANDRMDALVEKAAELGAAALQPLLCERSVLRLSGERAQRRCAHWQGVAIAASEQCGRTGIAQVLPVRELAHWLGDGAPAGGTRWLLHPAAGQPVAAAPPAGPLVLLSGPEGGFTEAERHAAEAAGFAAVGLGPRTLRADTAPLAALAFLALSWR